MKCPYCKADDTAVIDTRWSEDGASVRRRRECESCGKRFTTYERIELGMPAVVKTSGYRTGYDREKIRTGFMRALHKRPVFTTVGPIEQRPVVFDDTCYHLSCWDERNARSIASLLDSDCARELLGALVFWDAKRPITSDILQRIDLQKVAAHLGRSPALV